MNKLVNTIEALAVAVYAFRANNNRVLKEQQYYTNSLLEYPNKAYLYKYFVDSASSVGISEFSLSNELIREAESVKQQLEYFVTMAALTKGNLNAFITQCSEIISKEQISPKQFAYIIWIPKIVADNNERQSAKIKSATLEHSSKYVGKLGERIELHFNLIEKRFIGNINCWAAYGHDNHGNLISFLTKHAELCNDGMIKGRIKSIDRDPYHNHAQVTGLNHVKKL